MSSAKGGRKPVERDYPLPRATSKRAEMGGAARGELGFPHNNRRFTPLKHGQAMGKVTGFIEIDRQDRKYKPAADRIRHYEEFVIPLSEEATRNQRRAAWIAAFRSVTTAVRSTTRFPIERPRL